MANYSEPFTLRLPEELYQELHELSRVEGKKMAEVVREAIQAHIEARKRDPDFQKRLQEWYNSRQEVYHRLSGGQDG